MPMPNLSSMSVDQLLKLQAEVEQVLTRRAAQLRSELSKLSGSRKSFDGGGSPLAGKKVPIKYRDKAGNTWAGRGAQPVWLRERIKAGARLEQFAVSRKRKHR
jgi:DNA-binding protein H-NS